MTCFRVWRETIAALALLSVATLLIAAAPGRAAGAEAPARTASLTTSDARVHPNERITVRGRFRPLLTGSAAAGDDRASGVQPVRIQLRAFGAKHWRDARAARAGASGRFMRRVRIERSGHVRALSADGRATAARKVRVRSLTRARVERRGRVGRKVLIKGRVRPAGTRRRITIRVGGDKLRTRTGPGGRFTARWKPDRAGRERVRVRAAGNLVAAGSRAKAGRVTVFRKAEASWYGPGLYGNGVACGGRLKPSTIGVAHKSLPCGTKLTIRYHGRQVRAKVIDRGPYIPGREFDLTEALKNRLGMGGIGTILVDR
ncbi:MAG TPA: septal ring lytic transglycosylase RlpA family protein [Solirubrobacterales bacterium]|nr:septal ring lytic transglycosylase RlpA family protein [Solirubrobacterales bacterium]